MQPGSPRIIFLAVLTVSCLGSGALPSQEAPSTANGPAQDTGSSQDPGSTQDAGETWLTARTSTERRLAVGESHPYLVALAAGQCLTATVEQKGVDVQVGIFDPSGTRLRRIDSPTSAWGREDVLLVAQEAGVYRLEFRGILDALPTGAYSLVVDKLGPASEREEHLHLGLVAIERSYWLAEKAPTTENLRRALENRRHALQHFRSAGSAHGVLLAILDIADLERWLGHPREALSRLREARRGLSQEPSSTSKVPVEAQEDILPWMRQRGLRAQVEAAIGKIYLVTGAPELALSYYQTARRLAGKDRDRRWRSDLLNGLGQTYAVLGEDASALDAWRESLEVLGSDGHTLGRIWTWWTIAQSLESQGQTHQALDAYERVLARSRQASQTITYFRSLTSSSRLKIARLQVTVGRREEGMKTYRSALDRRNGAHDWSRKPDLLLTCAEVEWALGLYREARASYRLALERSTLWRHRQAAHYGLARLSRDAGELGRALAWSARAVDATESQWAAIDHSRASFLAGQLPIFELHIDLLMRLHRQDPSRGHDIAAFETSERLRARELLASLPRGHLLRARHGDERLWKQRETLQYQLDAWGRRESRRLHRGVVLSPAEVEAESADLNDLLVRFREAEDAVRAGSPKYDVLHPEKRLSLPELRRLALDEDTLLLEIALGEERSYLWAVSSDAIDSFELPPRATLEAAALSFNQLLTARGRDLDFETREAKQARVVAADAALPRVGHRLSQMLFGPVAGLLARQQLLIVADGGLQSVAFAALPHPSAGSAAAAPPLITRHALVTAPSASVIAALRQLRNPDQDSFSKTLAIFADPVFTASDPRVPEGFRRQAVGPASKADSRDSLDWNVPHRVARSARDLGLENFGRLPASREEAEAISGLLPVGESLRAFGFAARRDAVIHGGLNDFRILHFATHAVRNAVHPELSGVILSLVDERGEPINGFLAVQDVYGLDLRADLVVLSACQTALGREIRGEGLIGLPRAFMYAGAAGVVASLWSPEDRPAAVLMKYFYRALLEESRSPAEALRLAQLEMRRQEPWRAPYHWAAFSFGGDPRVSTR